MKIKIKMPPLKEGLSSAVLCEWDVSVGDHVKRGDAIAEIEVDKVVETITAESDMTVTALCAEEGDEVAAGDTIACCELDG